VVGLLVLKRERLTFAIFALAIQVAGWGLVHFRLDYGFTWLIWLVSLVVVTDIAGYFAGKALGGPKFWPAVSPKKTWSGTAAGWIAAALVGAIFAAFTNAGWVVVAMSVLLSFAGQMGDIAESAFKRRQGVKDSSALIPGHGGLFDRFDALLGAALALLLVAEVLNVPGVDF
jgi:phosphatidate cytidylyltransferase